MLNASWIWGLGVMYDTPTDRQAIVWMESQYLGVCSEEALRKILATTCNMFVFRLLACAQHVLFCFVFWLVGSGLGDTFTQQNCEVQRTTKALFVCLFV